MTTQLLLSLDYELFFGAKTGSVQHCLINPTNALVTVLDKFEAKVSLFVDVGFLIKLKEFSQEFPELIEQYNLIQTQLLDLSKRGHDLQLHIHPHWQDSYYTKNGWVINTKRYRLHDFSEDEIFELVKTYKEALEPCTLNQVFAFRAGGWCIQPFDKLKSALQKNNIWLDSTVYKNGHSDHPSRFIDFKAMPDKAFWRFSTDPLTEDHNGFFVEIPISAFKTSPLFFWQLAYHKKFSKHLFKPFGDGEAIISNGNYYLDRLTKTTYGPVMIDGFKSTQLQTAYEKHVKLKDEKIIFNVMGHPKSLSQFSLRKLETFLNENKKIKSITYLDLMHLAPSNTNTNK
jgi:hypothetical protein